MSSMLKSYGCYHYWWRHLVNAIRGEGRCGEFAA